MSTTGFNQQKAEAFTEKMVDVLNYGSLALMTSIGHRTGLFDTMSELPPAPISQIAKAADLHERYVREWLGAMVTGRIIEHDPVADTYRLPKEHAAALTRASAPNNMAAFTQYIGLLGSVEDGIVESFRRGGGVPYAAFPRFQDVMAEDSGQSVLPALLDHILPLVPGLTEQLQHGIEVLDLGCGRGLALMLMAQTFPKSRFTGYDFSENGVAAASAEARQRGLTNIRFAVQDAALLNERACYDLITTFDAIHDQAKPAAVLSNIYRALKPDGVYLMQDIAGSSHVHNNLDHPMGPFLYTVSTMHCMTVSLAYEGEGLGAMWGREKALEMLAKAGFTRVDVKELAHDIQNHYYINKK
ncbi:MAG: methyltransferase domain-containing protein [Anaerolineae bacterium]|nr:methyltransferase domain-containing protein [Anaerolineae bacterium]